MKVFTCNSFRGYYPVPTAAVVVAHSKEFAKAILEEGLSKYGLHQDIPLNEIKEIQTTQNEVIILSAGDY